MLSLPVCGQIGSNPNIDYTKNSADKNLRANARVNPSTLAMELSIPPAKSSTNTTVQVDRHGNQLSYDRTTKQWTDTFGRVLINPLPLALWNNETPSAGTRSYSYPGLNGGVRQFQLVWQKLSAQQSAAAYT